MGEVPDLGAAGQQARDAMRLPEAVIYANAAGISVQADGSICLRLLYETPNGAIPQADVIMPAAVFASGVLRQAHEVMAQAAERLSHVSGIVNQAVARRGAGRGGAPAPASAAEEAARQRRGLAGD